MKKSLLFVLILLVSVAVAADAFAQGRRWGRGMGGWGRSDSYQRLYNPDTVEELSGEVLKVDSVRPMRGMRRGIHLRLKSEDETLSVHLGPRWFLDNQEVQIEKRDQIKVKGSRITFEGEPAIIAAEIEKGDNTMILRDDNGFPVWAGWRKRGRE